MVDARDEVTPTLFLGKTDKTASAGSQFLVEDEIVCLFGFSETVECFVTLCEGLFDFFATKGPIYG